MQSFQFLKFDTLLVRDFPKTPLDQKQHLPAKSGVYFVISGSPNDLTTDTIDYIGYSKNIFERWNGKDEHHLLKNYLFLKSLDFGRSNWIAWMETEESEMHLLEAALIRHFKPPYNQITPSGKPPLTGRSTKSYKHEFFHVKEGTFRVNEIEDINWKRSYGSPGRCFITVLLESGRVVSIMFDEWDDDEKRQIKIEQLQHLALCVGLPDLTVKSTVEFYKNFKHKEN